jgi:hypothetical protein
LKLKYDNLLSSFAFKFNLRHYTKDRNGGTPLADAVGRCRLKLVETSVEITWCLQAALEAGIWTAFKFYGPLSSFASNFNVRRYNAVRHKHDTVTSFLRSQGSNLGRDMDNAAEQLCLAGATNDVAALRRLVG